MAGISSLVESRESRMAWFKEARFGMFIHWGLYTAAGGYWPPDPENGRKYEQHYAEWIKAWAKVSEPEYGAALKPLFRPEPGFAGEWAALAEEAGMRYGVLTTKHHEGYTLFNSGAEWSLDNPKTGGTNISPPGRDLVREYCDAFRARGLKPGFYFSLIDWQHPGGGEYIDYMHRHIRELADNYGEVCCLWSDFSSANSQGSHWRTREILGYWQEKQPAAIYNNRFWDKLENDFGDFFTPEKYIPASGFPGRYFEVNHTLNESYGFSYHDQNWKSPRQVAEMLSDIVSKGGNLLLNIGPDPRGRVPEPAAATLRGVGAWLRNHGDAIYGTEASPFPRLSFDGRCTRAERGGEQFLYLHLFSWPESGAVRLDALKSGIASATLLGGEPRPLRVGEDGAIHLPAAAPDVLLPVIAVKLHGPLEVDLYPHPLQAADRSLTLKAADAAFHSGAGTPQVRLEGDHIGWWTRRDDWIEFTFRIDQPQRIVHTGGTVEHVADRFEIVLDAACAAGAGGRLTLECAGSTAEIEVKPTGGWGSFAPLAAGTVSFDKPGEYKLRLRPAEITGQGLVNIRSVVLRPAAGEAGE